MTTVNQMKCACESCLCVVSLADAIQKMASTTAAKLVLMVIPVVKAAVILVAAATKYKVLRQLPSLPLKGVGKENFPTPFLKIW